jgi:predicted DNA-binding transcriptional regulator YafY
MIEYLSNGKKYTLQELSEKLEVSTRMIRVYKDEIEKAGIYIETIKGPYGGYVLNQDINIPKRFITPKEIKIENKQTFNIINKAVKEKRKCFIEYYSKDKKTTSKRIISPYELILLKNEWAVIANCELRNEIRTFYINRIKKIETLTN